MDCDTTADPRTGAAPARAVRLSAGPVSVEGELVLPTNARGVVLFAHGSGSGRHSPRNRQVARVLQDAGLATLLMDLLTAEEEAKDVRTAEFRFNVELLGERVIAAVDWLGRQAETARLRVGCFGASTGAAAALMAAAARPRIIGAVVSRGGRPDLAGPALPYVQAPTLLLVGGNDVGVIELNEAALSALGADPKQLEVVPGATHLFEEPGALDEVARLAAGWFDRYLGGDTR